jgi:hypothetical protein
MWRYKIKVKNSRTNEYDFIYYTSRSPSFNIHALIKQNNGSNANNFMIYEDNSFSWCGVKGYFPYYNAIDLLNNICYIHVENMNINLKGDCHES